MLGDRLQRPALGVVHRAHRAVGVEQHDLVHAHAEDLRGDAVGGVGQQEHRHRRDLGRRHLLGALEPRLLRVGVGRNGADHARPGEGRDAVGADVERRHVERDRARQADDAHLGRRVVRLAEIADQARGRGEVHEGARLLLLEVVGGGAADVERAVQMHVDHHLPVDMAHAMEDAVAQDAGIVDDAVDPAEVLDRGLDHALGAGRIGDAVAVGHGLAAGRLDLVADLLGRRRAAAAFAVDRAAEVVDHDAGAFPGGQQRHLAADAAARAGDQHDLVLQHVGHLLLPLSSL